jgi:beta-glucosidase
VPASPDADFPEGFLFGSSTAAHQVEGGNVNNDWWVWEHAAGTPAAEPSGDAIDQYHRYAGDFALLAGLGQNAHRMSLEWSRIEPEPGEFSRAALEHYRRVLGTLAEHGLEPFVTLHHFTLPRWFAQRGGWAARDAVDLFQRYCERVGRALGDLMPWACTINEPQIVARMGYLEGYFPPGLTNPVLWKQVTRTLMQAHAAAVHALGAGAGDPKAGLCLQLPDFEPARPGDGDCEAFATEIAYEMGEIYVENLSGAFVGVQYYTRERLDPALPRHQGAAPEDAPLTQMGWEINPDGLHRAIRLAARSGLPIVITENGIATADDAQRIAYMRDHLGVVAAAIRDGIDIRGFMYWSAFDNFEWNEGYRPRFGMVAIDYENDLDRVVLPSARAYGELARTRSLSVFDELP